MEVARESWRCASRVHSSNACLDEPTFGVSIDANERCQGWSAKRVCSLQRLVGPRNCELWKWDSGRFVSQTGGSIPQFQVPADTTQVWSRPVSGHVPSSGVRASPSLIDQAAPAGRMIVSEGRGRAGRWKRTGGWAAPAMSARAMSGASWGCHRGTVHDLADDSPTGKLMEAIIESVDEFYSENLAQEVTRGMRESASRGFFLASRAPRSCGRCSRARCGGTASRRSAAT